MRKVILTPNLCGSIRVAAKAGFLPREVWRVYFAPGNRRWQDRQWKALTDTKVFKAVNDYGFTSTILTLADKGKALAETLGLDPVHTPPPKNLYHDQELLRFALELERQGWITNWMTESEIKIAKRSETFFRNHARAPKIPDLIIEWNRPHDKILWAVELERTRKEMNRYYEMVSAYRGISNIDSVLVIAASDSIEANIKTAQGKLNYPQVERPMIFTSFHEVMKDLVQSELRIGANRTTVGKAALALTNIKAKTFAPKVKTGGLELGLNEASRKTKMKPPQITENTEEPSTSVHTDFSPYRPLPLPPNEWLKGVTDW